MVPLNWHKNLFVQHKIYAIADADADALTDVIATAITIAAVLLKNIIRRSIEYSSGCGRKNVLLQLQLNNATKKTKYTHTSTPTTRRNQVNDYNENDFNYKKQKCCCHCSNN